MQVRKLSDESNNSIAIINGIIKALFTEMEATINVVKESASNFERCSTIANSTEKSFGDIVHTINEVNSMISDISGKAGMQAANTDKISNIIRDASIISQDSFSQSELMHEGALKQSRQLVKLIEELDMLTGDIGKTHSVMEKFNV